MGKKDKRKTLKKTKIKRFNPNKCGLNEVWIALKVNQRFLNVDSKSYNFYVLVDAASRYILGEMISPAAEIDKKRVTTMFQESWEQRGLWPKKLMIPENFPARNEFKEEAEKNGIEVEVVPASTLQSIARPIQKAFKEFLKERW